MCFLLAFFLDILIFDNFVHDCSVKQLTKCRLYMLINFIVCIGI